MADRIDFVFGENTPLETSQGCNQGDQCSEGKGAGLQYFFSPFFSISEPFFLVVDMNRAASETTDSDGRTTNPGSDFKPSNLGFLSGWVSRIGDRKWETRGY